MVGALDFSFYESIDLFVGDAVTAGLKFLAAIGRKCLLAEDFSGQADTGTHFNPVIFMTEIIEPDFWRFKGVL